MAHIPAWLKEINEYIKTRPVEIEHEFTGPNRETRRNRRPTKDTKQLPLRVIGKRGFTQPGSSDRWHV